MYRKRKNPRKIERGIEMKRLIYAEDAMHRIEMETRFYSGTYAEIERAIDSAPTIKPKPNRLSAEWTYLGDGEWQCPVCKSIYGCGNDFKFKYCPECGSWMVNAGEGEDEYRRS